MSCEICGRSGCSRSFHSLESQEKFDERQEMSDDVNELRTDVQDLEESVADLKKELSTWYKAAEEWDCDSAEELKDKIFSLPAMY